jgi:hypothetical protein
MKNIFTLLLVLLFASCIEQDVYEFEKTSSKNSFAITLKARFQIIEDDGYCLYDFKVETPVDKKVRNIKFYDDKNFLLFRTDYNLNFSDFSDFRYDGKTKIATRTLLEKVDRVEFDIGY